MSNEMAFCLKDFLYWGILTPLRLTFA